MMAYYAFCNLGQMQSYLWFTLHLSPTSSEQMAWNDLGWILVFYFSFSWIPSSAEWRARPCRSRDEHLKKKRENSLEYCTLGTLLSLQYGGDVSNYGHLIYISSEHSLPHKWHACQLKGKKISEKRRYQRNKKKKKLLQWNWTRWRQQPPFIQSKQCKKTFSLWCIAGECTTFLEALGSYGNLLIRDK